MSDRDASAAIHLKLPATSANLGPGFDALGLALSLYLTIEARLSTTGESSIAATGRNADQCGRLTDNLILDTYADILSGAAKPVRPLALKLNNEIPLGMGCGSSAAALLAGVLLANHFGDLGWTGYEAMEEACRREGHPDNVAACWLGYFTASATLAQGGLTRAVTASLGQNITWSFMLVLPAVSLATHTARALLPEHYSRAEAVVNVQNTALLVAAFASNRGDLLRNAMADCLHQPFRSASCPLLPLLLPITREAGIFGVALSGAGPSVLVVHDGQNAQRIRTVITERLEAHGQSAVELLEVTTSKGTTVRLLR